MRVKLYIPYYPEGSFAGNDNDMTDEEYAEALLNNFGSAYSRYMNNVIDGFVDDRYDMRELVPDKYQIKSVKDTTKMQYYIFECELNNEEDEPMGQDEFFYYARSGEMCAFFVHIYVSKGDDWYRKNDDAVSELNFWLRDSRSIMLDPHIDDDHRVAMLPDKNLIIDLGATDNLMIPTRYALTGSRVIDQDNANNFAIIVNKIKNI